MVLQIYIHRENLGRIVPRGLVLLTMLTLAACGGDNWNITKIQVNPPGPLGGTNNVSPLVLIAPPNGGETSHLVPLTVIVQRSNGFTGPIFLQSRVQLTRPNQSNIALTLMLNKINANSNRSDQTLLQAFCRHAGQQAVLSIARAPATSASAPPTGSEVSFMNITGTPPATTSVNVNIDSGMNGTDFPLSRPADTPLTIICL